MECIIAEVVLELVPALGMLMRHRVIMPSIDKPLQERRRTNMLLQKRSQRLKELEAQGVDLMEFYRRLAKS